MIACPDGDFRLARNLSDLDDDMQPKEALHRVASVNQQEVFISNNSIHLLFQECARKKDLALCKKVHSAMVSEGFDSVPSLVDHLIRSYASCGGLVDGNHVFGSVSKPSLHSWNVIISAYAKLGQNGMAFRLFNQMQEDGVLPDKLTFLCILKACGSPRALGMGRLVHDLIIRNGFDSHITIKNTVIDMYAKCKRLEEAHKVFDVLPERDVVSWCAMIYGYAQHGNAFSALGLFEKMQQDKLKPSLVTFLGILKACGNVGAMWQGKWVHDQIIRSELETNLLVGSSLVDMYSKCGGLNEARCVFDELPKQNLVSWGAMITGYTEHGHGLLALELFEGMQQHRLKPTRATFLAALKACTGLGANEQGRSTHHQIIKNGLELDEMVGSSLVDMYAKCGSLREACKVFENLSDRDVVSWGAMIEGYAEHGHGGLALNLFERMQQNGIQSNKPTFLSSLKACGSIQALCKGRVIHDDIIRSVLESDTVISTSLVDMYAKCGSLEEAHKVFDKLRKQTVVSWSAIIAGYTEHGCGHLAFKLFEEMKVNGISPDKVTFSSILKACVCVGAIERGREVHEEISRSGLQSDVVVGTALVDMYSKCGSLEEARIVFDEMPKRNTLSWGAMIAGYAQHGLGFPALELFEGMQEEGIKPTKVTFLCVLKACGSIGAILHGRWIHAQIITHGLEVDAIVANTLMDMYARCGSLEESHTVFRHLKSPDVVSWAAMITGYAQHGIYSLAGQYIEAMRHQGLKPNDAIFASLLSACGQSGVMAEGCRFFKYLREEHGMIPSFEHYSCMIDLFGRGGRLSEAEDLFRTMPSLPNFVVRMSLLTHCRTFSNLEMGKRCFDEAVQLNLNDAPGYVVMLNMYAHAHNWENADKMDELSKPAGACKKPGSAWTEFDNKVCDFIVRDQTQTENDGFVTLLSETTPKQKMMGFVPS